MTDAKTINDQSKRAKTTVVSHVINDSTSYSINYLAKLLEPVLTNDTNDLEEMEGICGKVYIGLMRIIRANEKIGAESRPELELEQVVQQLKKANPVLA